MTAVDLNAFKHIYGLLCKLKIAVASNYMSVVYHFCLMYVIID